MFNLIKNIYNLFLDFAYPRICVSCEKQISDTKAAICFECQWNLPKNSNLLIHNVSQENKFWGKIKIDGVYCFLKFTKRGKVQNILHAIKYRNKPDLAQYLGRLFAQELDNMNVILEADALIPIPLSKDREQTRGYNQAEYIARGLSEVLNIPVETDIIKRTHKTQSQTKTQGRFKRYKNLESAFEVVRDRHELQNKKVILVDDVLTTGSTLEVAAKALLECGIDKLYVLTLAVA